MSFIRLTEQEEPSTPPDGKGKIFIDSADSDIKFKNDEGAVFNLGLEGAVGTGTALTDNFIVRGNGSEDIDIGNIFMSSDGNDLTIPGDLIQNVAAPTLAGSLIDATNLVGATGVTIFKNYAYVVSKTADSLSIIDVTVPASPTLVGVLIDTTELNGARSVYVSEGHAYIAAGNNDSLAIVDVSNPASPTLKGSIADTPNMNGISRIYVSGKYAFITSVGSHSLTVIDISDPANPIFVSSLIDATNMNGAFGLYISGMHAYIANINTDSLAIVDISDPTSLTLKGSLVDSTNLNGAASVYVVGKYAYVAAINASSFSVIDVSDPTSPSLAGVLIDTTNLLSAFTVHVSGKLAYVVSGGSDSLSIIDISTPASPVLSKVLIDSTNMDGAEGIFISGKHAYVAASSSNSLAVVDITGIDSPSATIGNIETTFISVIDNAIIGNDLYANSLHIGSNAFIGGDLGIVGNLSLSEIDGSVVQTVTVPELSGSLLDSTNLNGSSGVFVVGGYAYVGSDEGKSLAIIDISDHTSPTLMGSLIDATNLNGARGVFVSGLHHVYVAANGNNSLTVVDVSNPSTPVIAGVLIDATNMGGPNRVYISGQYAYVTGGTTNSLAIVDITEHTNPKLVGSLIDATNMNGAFGVHVFGDLAFVTGAGSNSLAIVDISNPASPTLKGSLIDVTNLNGAFGIDVSRNFAYVASSSSNSLSIIDISNPASPTLKGVLIDSTNLNGAISVKISGEIAYVVSNTSDSLSLIDISDPTTPTLLETLSDSTNMDGAEDIFISGTHVYITGFDSDSLALIDITGIEMPSAIIGNIETTFLSVTGNVIVSNDLYANSTHIENNLLVGGDLSVNSNFTISDDALFIKNPASTFEYQITASAIIADRVAALPLLISDDTFVFEDHAQTIINKTMNAMNNTFSGLTLGSEVNGASLALSDSATLARASNNLGFFAGTSSLELIGIMSDPTGTGLLVFGTSPTLVTPALGTPSALVLTNATGYQGDNNLVTVGTIITGVWTGTDVAVADGGTGSSTAAGARTNLGVDAAGTDNSTDVTLTGTPDYITISGQIITRGLIDLTSDVTGDLPVLDGGTGSSTAAGARTNLGVDAAGTDNSTDVTLTGTLDYITISGQIITRGLINLETDITGDLPVLDGGTGSSTASGARTNLGLVIGTDVQAFSSDNAFRTDDLSVFATTTSSQLAGVISDETGSGLLVFGTSPTIATPTLTLKQSLTPTPTAEGAIEWDTDGNQIVVGDGTTTKTFSADSDLSITESQISDLGTTVALVADNLSVFSSTTSSQLAGVISDETGSGLLVFGTSPTIVTPTITSFTNATHGHSVSVSGGTLLSTAALSDTDDIAYLNTANTYTGGGTQAFGTSAVTIGSNLTVDTTTLFVNSTSNIVGIGTILPLAKLNVLATTEQLRLSFNTSLSASFTVGSGGDLTIAPTGGDVNVTGNLAATGDITIGNSTTSGSKSLHISDQDDAFILLEADTDNTGGEDGNPYILFTQDNGGNSGIVGLVGASGEPSGGAFVGATANSILVGTLGSTNLHIGANRIVALTADTDGDVIVENNLSIGALSPDRPFHVEVDDTVISAITYVSRFSHTTIGVSAIGVGVGIEFEVETLPSNNNEVVATIETVATDVTAASEDFDLVFNLMDDGAAASEKMRITSDGDFSVSGTLITPTITSFVNATHNHIDEASGGTILIDNLSDVTTEVPFGVTITEIIDSTGDGTNSLTNTRGVVTDPSGNVFVVGSTTNNAFKITPAGVITQIIDSTGDGTNSLASPFNIATDPSGNIYVSGSGNNVFKISADLLTITQIIDSTGDGTNSLTGATGITSDPSGNIYVSGGASDNVFKISTPGTCSTGGTPCTITQIIDSTGDGTNSLDAPNQIATDSSGNIFVIGVTSANAFKISADLLTKTQIIDTTGDGGGNTLLFPQDIATDSSGNIFVVGNTSGNAFKISADLATITEIIDSTGDGGGNTLGQTFAVATDSSGNIFVTGNNTNNAFKISADLLTITEIIDSTGDGGGNTLSTPQGIATDSSGNVFVGGTLSANAFKISAATSLEDAQILIFNDATSVMENKLISGDATLDAEGTLTIAPSFVKNDQANTYTGGGIQDFGASDIVNVGSLGIGTSTITEKVNMEGGTFLQKSIAPTVDGSLIDATNMNGPQGIYVSGKYAYVAAFSSNSLAVIDISNSSSPILAGSLIDATNMLGSFDVYVSGNYAYVVSLTSDSLAIVDISDPTTPTLVGSLLDSTNLNGASGVYVAGNYAYVIANSSNRLTIIDISNPASPIVIGSLQDATNMNSANKVFVSGNYAYVTGTVSDSLAIIDITDPTSPTLTGSLLDSTNMNGAIGIYVSGNYAYVGGSAGNSLAIIDITDPTSPTLTGSLLDSTNMNGTRGVSVSGNYAYVGSAASNSLAIIDITDPTSPTLAGSLLDSTNLNSLRGVFVSGKHVYVVSSGTDRITVLDISGFDIPTADIGNAQIGYLSVTGNAVINNSLYSNSLNVGNNALIGGSLSVNGLNPRLLTSTTHTIFTSSDLDKLATSGVITITEDTTFMVLNDFISDVELNVTGGDLMITANFNEPATWTHSGTGTFITATGNNDVRVRGRARLVSSSTAKLVDWTGTGNTAIVSFADCTISGWDDLGTIRFGGLLLNDASFFSYSSPFILIDSPIIGPSLTAAAGGRIFDIQQSDPDLSAFTSLTTFFGVFMSAPPIRIDPYVPFDGTISQFVNVSTGSSSIAIFDTSGTTGTYTGLVDSSIASTSITSVGTNGGVAVFNHSGTDPSVGERVANSGYITNTDYNGTFFVTTVTAGVSFECEDGLGVAVAFGTGETVGSFTTTSITITSTAHGQSDTQTLTLDGDKTTQYDSGYKIYNAQTNTFDVEATFDAAEPVTGTWDTSGLDQSAPNVLVNQAVNNKISKHIVCAHVNANSTANGTIVNDTFTTMVFGTTGSALIESSSIERWKMIDEISATFECKSNEPYNGSLGFKFTLESSGGTVEFRIKWQISTDGGTTFIDFDDAIIDKHDIGSNAQVISNFYGLSAVKGDQIRPEITRTSGTSSITTTHATVYGLQ